MQGSQERIGAALMRGGSASIPDGREATEIEKQSADERDRDLVLRIAAGEQDAMKILFDRYRSIVFGVAMANLRDRDTAMDVVSNVMIGIWRSAASFSRKASVKSWILGITFHKINDVRKVACRRYEVSGDDVDESEDPSVSWDRGLTATQRDDLQECLCELPYDQRKAVHLCFYEDLSSTEIAEVLGMKAETVRTRLFHARMKLKACVENKVESRRILKKFESRRNRV